MELVKIFFLLAAIVAVEVSSKTDDKRPAANYKLSDEPDFCAVIRKQVDILKGEIAKQCSEQSGELTNVIFKNA